MTAQATGRGSHNNPRTALSRTTAAPLRRSVAATTLSMDMSVAACARASASARASHRVTAYLEMLATGPLLPPSVKGSSTSAKNSSQDQYSKTAAQYLMPPSIVETKSSNELSYIFLNMLEEERKMVKSIQDHTCQVSTETSARLEERANRPPLWGCYDWSEGKTPVEFHWRRSMIRSAPPSPNIPIRPPHYPNDGGTNASTALVAKGCGNGKPSTASAKRSDNKLKKSSSSIPRNSRPFTAPPGNVVMKRSTYRSMSRTASRGCKQPSRTAIYRASSRGPSQQQVLVKQSQSRNWKTRDRSHSSRRNKEGSKTIQPTTSKSWIIHPPISTRFITAQNKTATAFSQLKASKFLQKPGVVVAKNPRMSTRTGSAVPKTLKNKKLKLSLFSGR